MEIFDKIGQKATEAYKVTADKTGKIAREAKIKIKTNDLKAQISVLYKEIGAKVYEKHTLNENIDIKKDLEEECTKIDMLSEEIESNLKHTLELRDKRKCNNCSQKIDIEANFCPNCGTKQEKVEFEENEDKQENSSTSQSNNTENTEKAENSGETEKQEEKSNLEKTVEIEADVKPETNSEANSDINA